MGAGERIAARRKELGRSLTWLARQARISKSFLCEIERGRKGLGAGTLLALAAALGTTCDALMPSEASGLPATALSVPPELAALADRQGLPFRAVLALLGVRRVLEAYVKRTPPGWPLLWERLRPFIEEQSP